MKNNDMHINEVDGREGHEGIDDRYAEGDIGRCVRNDAGQDVVAVVHHRIDAWREDESVGMRSEREARTRYLLGDHAEADDEHGAKKGRFEELSECGGVVWRRQASWGS